MSIDYTWTLNMDLNLKNVKFLVPSLLLRSSLLISNANYTLWVRRNIFVEQHLKFHQRNLSNLKELVFVQTEINDFLLTDNIST